ncbi:unnamed protein product [Paramecium sonneborni]|uniref:WD40-repeat-containing domain n=1 Tax=Paramecium sonneborni TaxID=65129 RepID=A0A8S1PIX9_9CILI|nr:unnamed protein product [Paramecium sonneborni]
MNKIFVLFQITIYQFLIIRHLILKITTIPINSRNKEIINLVQPQLREINLFLLMINKKQCNIQHRVFLKFKLIQFQITYSIQIIYLNSNNQQLVQRRIIQCFGILKLKRLLDLQKDIKKEQIQLQFQQNESQDVQQAHEYQISALAFSYDCQLIASSNIKGVEPNVPIFLWNLSEKKLMIQLKGHQDSVNCLEFSKCTKFLVSGSSDGKIIYWNIEYPQAAKILYVIDEFNHSINSLSISPKEQTFVAFCNLNNIQKWNFEKIERYQKNYDRSITLSSNLDQYNFISNDQFIYLEKEKNQLTILNIESKKELILEENSQVTQIITSKNGEYILCLEKQGVYVWKKKNNDNQWYKQNLFIENSMFFLLSPNNQYLFQIKDTIVDSQKKKITTINFQKLGNLKRIFLHDFKNLESQFEKLNINLKNNNFNWKITIFDTYNRNDFKIIEVSQVPKNIQISEDKKYLACYNENQESQVNSICIWQIENLNNPPIYLKFSNGNLRKYQFCGIDSSKIYAIYSDGTIWDWNVNKQTQQLVLDHKSEIIKNDFITFSRNLRFLANQSLEQQQIVVYDFSRQECIQYQVGDINKIQFSYNEEMLVVAFSKFWITTNYFKLLIIEKNQKPYEIDLDLQSQIVNISFSLNQIIFSSNKSIQLWNLNQNLEASQLGEWMVPDFVYSFEFDFSKSEIALKLENTIMVIQLKPTVLKTNQQDIMNQKCICISPDNKYYAVLTSCLAIYEVQNLKKLNKYNQYEGQMVQFQSDKILVLVNKDKISFINISELNKLEEIKKCTQHYQVPDSTINYSYNYQITDITINSKYSLISFKNNENKKQSNDQNDEKEDDQAKIIAINVDNDNVNKEKTFFEAIFSSIRKPIITENGKYFALCQQKKIQIINSENLLQKKSLLLHEKVNQGQIFYSHDGEQIFLFTHNCFQILDPQTLASISEQQKIDFEVTDIQISQNWKYFALLSSPIVKIYSLHNKKELKIFKEIKEEDININCISLSPKGDLLLIGGQQDSTNTNTISLWSVEQGQQQDINKYINDKVKVIKFCPDGINFAAGLQDGSVNLYLIDISQTKYFKDHQNQNSKRYNIYCYQSFAQQSLLLAQECFLNTSSKSTNLPKSIIQLLLQKGAKQQ